MTMIIPAHKLPLYLRNLDFPLPIKGLGAQADTVLGEVPNATGLLKLVAAGTVMGVGTWNRIRYLRPVLGSAGRLVGDSERRVCGYCRKRKPADQFGRPRWACRDCANAMAYRCARLSGNERRARQVFAGGSHTQEQWQAVLLMYGNHCLRCGKLGTATLEGRLAKDHIRPVRHGGNNDIENLQPLCKSCNSWKHDREFDFRPKAIA